MMDPARWEQLKDLFTELTQLNTEDRELRLQQLDSELRDELRSLLPHAESAFLEKPAAQHAIDLMNAEEPPLLLGPYRLLRELGRGGMATVYLAERADGQFQKQVAVKVLRAGIYGDDMRRRFLRERQLLAGLDHANIVRLIDGNVLDDGRPYLIEDFVDGEPITVYARSVTQPQRVALFADVVKAVVYAHGRGVVHRDLKPANILVTAEGVPKLLDFGVARMLDVESVEEGTETQSRYWTPAYASPEQAKGLSAGPPSDIYSLGLILYELLTGRPAVSTKGLSSYEAARKVVEYEPDLQDAPLPLRDLLTDCLRNDPAHRCTAPQLYQALQQIDWSKQRTLLPSRRNLLLAGSSVCAAAAAVWGYRQSTQPRFYELQQTTGNNGTPSLSPDGNSVVYRNQDRGVSRLLVVNRHTGSSRQLVEGGTQGLGLPSSPEWSPDGKWIAFRNTTSKGIFETWVIAAGGDGVPRRIAKFVGVSLAWTMDSKAVLVSRRQKQGAIAIWQVSLDGSKEVQITSPPQGVWGDLWMSMSRDGQQLATVRYVTPGDGDVYLFQTDGTLVRRLTEIHGWINGIAFHPRGSDLLYSTAANGRNRLWLVSTRGNSSPHMLSTPAPATPQFPNWGPSGHVVFASEYQRVTTYRGRTGEGAVSPRLLASPEYESDSAAYRPDGGAVAWAGWREGERGIWLVNRDGTQRRRVGDPYSEVIRELSWCPDMRHIAFTMASKGRPTVWILDVQSGQRRPLHDVPWSEGRPSWSADGRSIYFHSDRGGARRFYRMPWPAGGEAKAITPVAVDGVEAPGGQSFLYLPNDQSTIMEVGLNGAAPHALDGVPAVRMGHWLAVSGAVVYLDDHHGNKSMLYTYDFAARTTRHLADISVWRPGLLPGLAVSPDFKEMLWVYPDSKSTIWIAEGLA